MDRIPLFPLGLVLLPGMALPLHIFEERYKQMISECLADVRPFGIVWFDGQSIRSVGCTAGIIEVLHRYDDGRMDILTRGERRFFTEALIEEKPYLEADVRFIDDEEIPADPEALEGARRLLMRLLDARYLNEAFDESVFSNAHRLSFAIPALEGFNPAERQRFLEMTSAAERLRRGIEALEQILDRVRLTQQIERIISGNGHPPGSVLQKLFAGKGQKGD